MATLQRNKKIIDTEYVEEIDQQQQQQQQPEQEQGEQGEYQEFANLDGNQTLSTAQQEYEQGANMIIELEQLPGITQEQQEKLRKAGMTSVASIAMASVKHLTSIIKMDTGRAERLIEEAKLRCGLEFGFIPATIQHTHRRELLRVCTGSVAIDQALGGGVETGSITELFGEYRTGKSQICHTLCVTCQLRYDEGGAEGRALYIDTEGTFRPERLEPIAKRFGLELDAVLENVQYARAYNSEHQMQLLAQAANMMSVHRYALVIVDSVTSLYRTDYTGRSQLADRQQSLAKYMRSLMKLADEFGVAIVITNQVTANPGAMNGPTISPIGGNIIAHASTTRIKLTKHGRFRKLEIVDSPCQPETSVAFDISEGGIVDTEAQSEDGPYKRKKFI